jgi:hypothetical protein
MSEADRAGEHDAPGVASPALVELQQLALDVIGAARTLLDAAESAVRDPVAVDAVARSVTDGAKAASMAAISLLSLLLPSEHNPEETSMPSGEVSPEGVDQDGVG